MSRRTLLFAISAVFWLIFATVLYLWLGDVEASCVRDEPTLWAECFAPVCIIAVGWAIVLAALDALRLYIALRHDTNSRKL